MLSDIELTLLGIVAAGPYHVSELERMIAARGVRDWLMVGTASLYYILSKLEEQGLIVGQQGESESEQRVFQITGAGRGVLQTAVIDLLSRQRSLDSFSLGLANLHVLRPAQTLRALLSHQRALAATIAQLETARDALRADADLATRALIDRQLALARAEQSWLWDFIDIWRAAHPSVRETEETRSSPETGSQPDPHETTARTRVHHRTAVHRHKRIQLIKRLKNDQGGTSE